MTDVVFVLQAPAPTALADPRAILGLARMCRGGPGLGPVERISAARALWSACLAEGDGAWHVEETEGAIASLAALLANASDVDLVRSCRIGGQRAAQAAQVGPNQSRVEVQECKLVAVFASVRRAGWHGWWRHPRRT